MTQADLSIINSLKLDFSSTFGNRVLNLVLFGSTTRDKECNDIDIHLLLDTRKSEDILLIRNILLKQKKGIDFMLSYKDQLIESKYFRIRAQGRYFLNSLAFGQILLGDHNHYLEMLNKQNRKEIIKDLMFKNSEYQNYIREYLFEPDLLDKQTRLAKYLIRYINQILIIKNELGYENLLKFNKNEMIDRISKINFISLEEKLFLKKIHENKEQNIQELINNTAKLLLTLEDANTKLMNSYDS
jgi:hypothetical protein